MGIRTVLMDTRIDESPVALKAERDVRRVVSYYARL